MKKGRPRRAREPTPADAMDDTDVGVLSRQLADKISCPIRRVIVYKDGLPPDAIKGGFETREQRPNVFPSH
jgi:hypothetical protein